MKEPRRLLEDENLESDLRDGLRAARTRAPVEYDESAGLKRLQGAIGAGAIGLGQHGLQQGAAALKATKVGIGGAAKLTLSLKTIVVGVGLLGATAGGVWWGARRSIADVDAGSTAVVSAVPVVGSVPTGRAEARDPASRGARPTVSAGPPSSAAAADASVPASSADRTLAQSSGARSASAISPERSIEAETAQYAEVRRAGGDPTRALALAEEGSARYPGGVFALEREVIAIFALSDLGRSSQASVRARRFLAAHPESSYRERLEQIAGH